MANFTHNEAGPSASRQYILHPVPPLLSFISDQHLLLFLPTISYWAYGLLFYWIDHNGYLSKYRLHTPAEVLKRNRVPMSQVIYSILFYQFVTTLLGLWLMRGAKPDAYRDADFDISAWLARIRSVENGFEMLYSSSRQTRPISIAEKNYSLLAVSWQLFVAKAIHHFCVPAFQFALAIFVADTWQYFEHRVVHMNQYLYVNFHSVHHRIYVPYAFGAFYSNIYEQFVVDVFGTYLALQVPQLSTRQSILFTTLSTLKAAHDHCGYSIPWHPFELCTRQGALYHDVHHQSWGIKSNYSQLYSTFWDRVCGTMWAGGADGLSKRYEGVSEVDVRGKWEEDFGEKSERLGKKKFA